MKRIYKRLMSFLLCVLLALSVPLSALADTPGGSGASQIPVIKPGGGGYLNNPAPIFRDYGFRVTMTTSSPMADAGVTRLTGAYTKDELAAQRQQIMNISKTRYWEPGDDGLYFWKGLNTGIKPNFGVVSANPGDGFDIRSHRITMQRGTVSWQDNTLAWYCYPGTTTGERTPGMPAFNQQLYDIIVKADSNYANGDDWLYHVKQLYGSSDYKDKLVRLISDGEGTATNIRNFSWDTDECGETWNATAQDYATWSQTGYLTMLIQFAWLAQDVGNMSTYESFKNKIWGWVCSGYAQEAMPILMIEACQEVGLDGTATAANNNCQLVTLPYTLSAMYGSDCHQQLFAEWPVAAHGSTEAAIKSIVGNRSPINKAYTGQALGYYYAGGLGPFSMYADRAFCRLLWPCDDTQNVYGYIVGFTYVADNGFGSGNPGKPGGTTADGSFTWKLNPKGVHDVSPDTEVNASSTVYDINMSQSGYNNNNYSKWESMVNSDGVPNNKVKVCIYRISQSLPDDVKATEYTRGQVQTGGQPVTNTVDRVVRSNTLEVTNIPVLGTLKACEVIKLGKVVRLSQLFLCWDFFCSTPSCQGQALFL